MFNLIKLVIGDIERSLEISSAVYDKRQPSWNDFNQLRNTLKQCKEVLETAPERCPNCNDNGV